MPVSNYLLIIDNSPIHEGLKEYFAKFNIDIVHLDKLESMNTIEGLPAAILIDWSILAQAKHRLQEFYQTYPVPLLVIHDRADEKVCVEVLEQGADDFIIKPLYPRELHARISAINRRVNREQEKTSNGKEVYQFANWRLYPASRQVLGENGEELNLSAGEYDLLYIFVQQPHKVLDREFLLQITKNSDLNPYDRRIDVQISRLRHKIEIDGKKPGLIKTIRNGGYMFTTDVVIIKEQSAN